jgi:hypothetical protein
MLIYCTNNKTRLGCAEDVFVFPMLLEESVENMCIVFAVPGANPIAFADVQFMSVHHEHGCRLQGWRNI